MPSVLRRRSRTLWTMPIRHGAPTKLTLRVRHPLSADIEVEDDGPGIPPELWPRLRKVRVTFAGGIRAWVVDCRRVLAAHGGSLTFRSRDGNGFTVVLTCRARLDPWYEAPEETVRSRRLLLGLCRSGFSQVQPRPAFPGIQTPVFPALASRTGVLSIHAATDRPPWSR